MRLGIGTGMLVCPSVWCVGCVCVCVCVCVWFVVWVKFFYR
jgi:hypothetical protein